MSTPEVRSDDTSSLESIDAKLEVVVVPVSDIDRAKEFYQRLGWRLDVTPPGVVQLTPHGSRFSVQFGVNLTSAAPGSGKGYLTVSDFQAACDAPIEAGPSFWDARPPPGDDGAPLRGCNCGFYIMRDLTSLMRAIQGLDLKGNPVLGVVTGWARPYNIVWAGAVNMHRSSALSMSHGSHANTKSTRWPTKRICAR